MVDRVLAVISKNSPILVKLAQCQTNRKNWKVADFHENYANRLLIYWKVYVQNLSPVGWYVMELQHFFRTPFRPKMAQNGQKPFFRTISVKTLLKVANIHDTNLILTRRIEWRKLEVASCLRSRVMGSRNENGRKFQLYYFALKVFLLG